MWYANVNERLTGLIYVVSAPSVPSVSHFSLNEKGVVQCGQNTIITVTSCIILHPADLLRASLKAGQLHLRLSSL